MSDVLNTAYTFNPLYTPQTFQTMSCYRIVFIHILALTGVCYIYIWPLMHKKGGVWPIITMFVSDVLANFNYDSHFLRAISAKKIFSFDW